MSSRGPVNTAPQSRSVTSERIVTSSSNNRPADSALEDCQVQVSRTAPISAIPGRSPWQGPEGRDWPGGPAVAGKMGATV